MAGPMPELGPLLTPLDATHVQDERGAKLIYFGGCDYFRLSWHPKIRQALRMGIGRYGVTVAASRKTTGNHVLYETLEVELAKFFGAKSAVLVSNGYMAAMTLAQGLSGTFAHALIDVRAHASLWDATAFLGCPTTTFEHGQTADVARHVKRLLAEGTARPLILLTDGMFAHDGSVPPLKAYRKALPDNAMLLVDDAHGGGVLGANGRGAIELEGIGRAGVIQTVTLSKAFGVYGGAVLCDGAVRRCLLDRSRIFTGNTPLPLPWAAAALEALKLLGPGSELRSKLRANARRVKESLGKAGMRGIDTPGPVVSVRPENVHRTAELKHKLLKAGIYPSFVVYPGGPEGGHFRFAISSAHTRSQLDRLIEVLCS